MKKLLLYALAISLAIFSSAIIPKAEETTVDPKLKNIDALQTKMAVLRGEVNQLIYEARSKNPSQFRDEKLGNLNNQLNRLETQKYHLNVKIIELTKKPQEEVCRIQEKANKISQDIEAREIELTKKIYPKKIEDLQKQIKDLEQEIFAETSNDPNLTK